MGSSGKFAGPGPTVLMQEETRTLLAAMRNGEDSDHVAPKMSSSMAASAAAEIQVDSGERRLNELGYKQELRREMVIASLTLP